MNIQSAAQCFSQLGHKRRLEILKILIKTAPNGLTMGEIASKTKIPHSTLTHHMKFLEDSNLIIRIQESQSIRCRVNIQQIKALMTYLLKECCIDSIGSC